MGTKAVRFSYISLLRVFATLIVVLGHSMIIYVYKWGIFTPAVSSDAFNILKQYIDTFQMPLFVFIAGFLYYRAVNEKGRYTKLSDLVKEKAYRLLIPYIVISLFYLVPIRYAVEYDGYINNSFLNVLIHKIILMRDAGNLWFLGMLFGVFVITWIIENKTKFNALTKAVLYVFFYFVWVLIPQYLQIHNILHYLVFFYLGGLAYRYRYKLDLKIPVIAVIFAISVICYIGYLYFDAQHGVIYSVCENAAMLFASLNGILFLFALSLKLGKTKITDKKIVNDIDKNSYGIYLFHEAVIYVVYYFLGKQSIPPVLFVAVNFILGLSAALVITLMLRRCNLGFVIGEKKSANRSRRLESN